MHESCPTGMLSYVKETNGDKDFFLSSLFPDLHVKHPWNMEILLLEIIRDIFTMDRKR